MIFQRSSGDGRPKNFLLGMENLKNALCEIDNFLIVFCNWEIPLIFHRTECHVWNGFFKFSIDRTSQSLLCMKDLAKVLFE